ncbi:MAG TPA: GNAT family protein [Candidatus Sulfomarinibacteraceae bacterium]|nr:GNAT family protein [Candidatus Sulfomarinibacteraceae bacterium]
MDDSLTIREARDADADALFELHLEALRANPTAFAADPQETAADRSGWIGRLKRNLAMDMGAICLAETSEGIVGMSGIFRRTLAKMQHTATIWGTYVKPGWRGQGLGERLLQANLAWARRHRVHMVRLAVVATNVPAIRCYLRQGFAVYGVEPDALLHEGRYYDELWMTKRIGGAE